MYRLSHNSGPTTVVTFSLTGDALNPHTITKSLNFHPTKSWVKDTSALPPRYTGAWFLSPSCSPTVDIDEQLYLLLETLEILPDTLSEFIKTYNGQIIIGHTNPNTNFGFTLDNGTINRLSGLGLRVQFDLYYIESESPVT